MTNCISCGHPVERYSIGYDQAGTTRYRDFDQHHGGVWIRHPLTGQMRRIGRDSHTDLTRYRLHSCINDDPAFD